MPKCPNNTILLFVTYSITYLSNATCSYSGSLFCWSEHVNVHPVSFPYISCYAFMADVQDLFLLCTIFYSLVLWKTFLTCFIKEMNLNVFLFSWFFVIFERTPFKYHTNIKHFLVFNQMVMCGHHWSVSANNMGMWLKYLLTMTDTVCKEISLFHKTFLQSELLKGTSTCAFGKGLAFT